MHLETDPEQQQRDPDLGQQVDRLGAPDQAAPAAGQWVEWDVTTALSGSGLVSFSLTGSSGNSVYFSSLEGANPPQLVVTP